MLLTVPTVIVIPEKLKCEIKETFLKPHTPSSTTYQANNLVLQVLSNTKTKSSR